jgi:broad specificity phosphatase PhoE
MAPTIHIVRHAQALHNAQGNHNLPDPVLTDLGHTQCTALNEKFKEILQEGVISIVASPMKRTIQTATEGYLEYTTSRTMMLLPMLQETGLSPSDTGSARADLEKMFGDKLINYSLVTPDWMTKPTSSAERARSVRRLLRTMARAWRDTDHHIIVVTHGQFIFELLGNDDERMFRNTEFASCQFENLHGRDLDARLVETAASRVRRKKS